MSNELNNFELVEDYLQGNLSPEAASTFENQMASNQALKDEVSFQKDIINGLKDARAGQLKARLNGIDAGAGTSSSVALLKIAAGVVLVGSLVGGYFYFDNKEEMADQPAVSETEVTIEQPEETGDAVAEVITEEETQPEETVEVVEETQPTTENKNSKIVRKPVIRPNIVLPDVSDDFDDNMTHDTTGADIDVADVKTDNSVDWFEIETLTDKNYKFHYKFNNNKLVLYGDFSNEPYEIIELNKVAGKKLYLFYHKEFYPLEQKNTKITPLVKLEDANLIKELKLVSGAK